MFKFFLRFITLFLFLIATVTIHLIVVYIFPFPWNTINSVFLILLLYFLSTESGRVVWLAFLAHFFLELYPVQNFGVVLIPAVLSFLISYWLYRSFFTNKSVFTTALLMAILLFSYRLFYTLAIIFTKQTFSLPWSSMLLIYFFEFILTVGFTTLLFVIFTRVSPRLRSYQLET